MYYTTHNKERTAAPVTLSDVVQCFTLVVKYCALLSSCADNLQLWQPPKAPSQAAGATYQDGARTCINIHTIKSRHYLT